MDAEPGGVLYIQQFVCDTVDAELFICQEGCHNDRKENSESLF